MTVKELIEKLKTFDENMDVFMNERKTDFTFGLVNSVKKQEVVFTENPDYVTELHVKDDVVILSEE